MRYNRRDRYKKSDLDTNQKQLTINDKWLFYTADDDTTIQLTMQNQFVEIINNAAFLLVMPSVSEAKMKTIKITVKETGQAVTLTDYPSDTEALSDSNSWGGDYTLNTAEDSITLHSDGQSWTVVSNDIV